MNNIKIVDSIMGSGKSSAARNLMNSSNEKKFVFVTPYLDEAKKASDACREIDLQYIPDDYLSYLDGEEAAACPTKTARLKWLLERRCSVAITHQLFKNIDFSFENLLSGYTLIHDEAPSCIEEVNIKSADKKAAKKLDLIEIDENTNVVSWIDYNKLDWLADEERKAGAYDGDSFSGMRKILKSDRVIQVRQGFWYKVFDSTIFTYFDDVYILTFRFDYSLFKFYLKKYEIGYELYHIENGVFVKGYQPVSETQLKFFRDNIKIYESKVTKEGEPSKKDNINKIGDDYPALNKSWYIARNNKQRSEPMRKAYNFFRKLKIGSSQRMWTTYKDYSEIKGVPKELKNNFTPCNMIASNEYGDRTGAAYLCNIYINPELKDYLGIDSETECGYALNMLLQWLFRSAIRNGQPIFAYIPSSRMRNLLKNFLKG